MENYGLNFYNLYKRGLPKTKPYLIQGRFADNAQVHVEVRLDEAAANSEFVALYSAFLRNNKSRIASVVHWSSLTVDYELEIEKLIMPWDPASKYEELIKLSQAWRHVGIPGHIIEEDPSLAARLLALSNEHNTTYHAINCGRPDNLRAIKFETSSTMSWLAPMLRGETIVWSGNQLVRYPKKMKDQARSRLSAVCTQADLSFDKIKADDANECVKLAIWSYRRFEESLGSKLVTMKGKPLMSDSSETDLDIPDNKGMEMRNFSDRESAVLPVFSALTKVSTETIDGEETEVTTVIPASGSSTLRMCDTCFVKSQCPAFQTGASCKFNLPIEIKTKEQHAAMLQVLLEMQAARIGFARMAEEMAGGYPDPNLSQEIDRYFAMEKKTKEINETGTFVKVTMEAREGTSGGVLSQVFGSRVQQLPQVMSRQEIDLQAAEILDVESEEVSN